jgi:hypothetical protein
LKRVIMLLTVVTLMAVMLSVSAPVAFADPKPDDPKTLCKDNGYLSVVGVLEDGVTTFADQGECVSFVEELGGALFPRVEA